MCFVNRCAAAAAEGEVEEGTLPQAEGDEIGVKTSGYTERRQDASQETWRN